MLNYFKKTTGEFFYAIFASFVLFAAMFLFVLSILLPFIAALFVAQNNPGIHPLFVFGTIFGVAYAEHLFFSLFDYFKQC